MSIYSSIDSGTSNFKSRFTRSISNRMRYDCRFQELVPVLKRFCLPGDVWRIKGEALVRFLPMISPSMTPYTFIVRYFFVPLRLLDPNTELIITGSKDGHLYNGTLPEFPNLFANADKVAHPYCYKIAKYSFWDYMNVQLGDYENIKDSEFLPAEYWEKGYFRIAYDYYWDENYNYYRINFNDFEAAWDFISKYGADFNLFTSALKKDYFTSALPWQLKGTAPVLDVTGISSFTPNYDFGDAQFVDGFWRNKLAISVNDPSLTNRDLLAVQGYPGDSNGPFVISTGSDPESTVNDFTKGFENVLNQTQSNLTINGLGFNADELRVMMAQTRIFERLARCGSRYTEYLYSNFGTAPADETLQRPKYLGGWKIPIVVTEVLQTAEDGTTPVGTMRGHGITRGGNTIKDFYCKEFGLLFGLAEIRPKIEYTTGIPRQLTYKKRFDFFNPSFQHLSEQETRNGELYVNFTADENGHYDNDDTFGFQAYGNELRSSQDEVVGDMRDSLKFWGSQLSFSSRPNAQGLISSSNHLQSFNSPFVNTSSSARNIIVDFNNLLDVYRPMVRYSTPGLVDHF